MIWKDKSLETKIRRYTNSRTFIHFFYGVFMSKILYGIAAWGCVSRVPGQPDIQRCGIGFTKRDILRHQALQNKALRLINHSDLCTPTRALLKETKQLSINQHIAYHIILQTYKKRVSRLPEYYHERLFEEDRRP